MMGTISPYLPAYPAASYPQQPTLSGASTALPGAVALPVALQSAYRQPPVLTASYTSPAGFPVYCYTLGNGHRVVLEQRPTDVVSLRTFINTGSIYENPVKPSRLYPATGFPSGMAHLDEHCNFLQTRNFPVKNTWNQAVEQYGADFNASTDTEAVQHELVFNREDWPAMLAMHAESILYPRYHAQNIAQEKTNVLNEWAMRMAPPEQKVYSKLHELLFDRPGFQTLGRREDIANATAQQLQQFHQTFYTPTNMVTVIAGRLEPHTLVVWADRYFGNTPPRPGPLPQAAMRSALPAGQVRAVTVPDPQLNHSMVHLGFLAPPLSQFKERVAMEVLMALLEDGPTSLLESEVKQRLQLAAHISADYEPMKQTGMVGFQLETRPGQEQQTLQATLQTVSRLSLYPVSEAQLLAVQNRLANAFDRETAVVETATHLLGQAAISNTLPYYLQYKTLLYSLSPTDLMHVAQKYLNPQSYAVVFGVPGHASPSTPSTPPQVWETAHD